MQLIDTHNHLGCDIFDNQRIQIVERCIQLGVKRQISIAINPNQWQKLKQLTIQFPSLYYACGYHPLYLPDQEKIDQAISALFTFFKAQRHNDKLCALGEIGLDYYQQGVNKNYQQTCFKKQLSIATELNFPVLLHVVRAHADAYILLKQTQFKQGGIVHAFSGSLEEATNYIKLGFKIGLGGNGTYPQNHRMHRLIKALPLEAIVLETDAPDLPPVNHQTERNSPTFLPEICQLLANIKDIPIEQLAEITTTNACKLFNWNEASLSI